METYKLILVVCVMLALVSALPRQRAERSVQQADDEVQREKRSGPRRPNSRIIGGILDAFETAVEAVGDLFSSSSESEGDDECEPITVARSGRGGGRGRGRDDSDDRDDSGGRSRVGGRSHGGRSRGKNSRGNKGCRTTEDANSQDENYSRGKEQEGPVGAFRHVPNAAIPGHNKERHSDVSASQCATLCLETTDFMCYSFDYDRANKRCWLSNKNSQVISLKTNFRNDPYDYYERKGVECFVMWDKSDYRGTKTTTVGGETCQKWSSQSPHSHIRTEERYPNMGLGDHNYCRNPDGEEDTWCYTSNPNVRWEFCDVGQPGQTCDP
ncbi:uncharacterized protein LOC102803543, partial [Saccoglossus kowalevskii]|uniref:Uncharacterized protein LOC102803543 n=1 Tax=Saccoglossus kowalevskii TaxID=10224 RepID=A0ABM0MLG5_SACKO